MRLIDADALITLLKECQQLDWRNNIAPISWNHALDNFIEVINDEPTIEAEPIRRGRWLKRTNEPKHTDWYSCSVCRGQFDYMWKHCPNCGAKMEDGI